MQEARPVFVVGPPRSGAALLFEFLSYVPAFSPLREVPDVLSSTGRFELPERQWSSHRLTAADATPDVVETVRAAYLQRLHHQEQRSLEQTEQNSLRVPFLAELFPAAQFVCVHRGAAAAIDASLATWRASIAVTEPVLPDWNELPWSLALIPEWRALIGRPLPEIVTRQWIAATSILLDDLESLPGHRWHAVSFEAMAADPAAELSRLCAFLGTDLPPIGAFPQSADPVSPDIEPFLDWTTPVAERAAQVFARRAAITVPSPQPRPPVEGVEAFRSVSTPQFPEILHDLGISLVVTTYQSNRVILVRAPQRTQLNTHLRILPAPMGVASRNGTMAIGTQQEVIEFRNQPIGASFTPPNDAVWVPSHVHITGNVRIHELAWASDELWVVNTLFSSLCTLDPRYNFVPRWRPPFVTHLAAEDRCHLNGMAVVDDRVRYVTALGETNDPSGWRTNKPAGGVVIDVESGETVVRGLAMPHSPRWYADQFWFLESGRGTLARADLDSGAVTTITEMPGFTRGLAFAGPYAFVGLSQVRESNVFGGIPLVDRLKDRVCGVWIVDLRSGETVAFLRFEGIVQEIFDVQVLHGARFPELLEPHDPRVGTSLVIPEDAMRQLPPDGNRADP